jgi:alkyl sulfatase BDS1-like metallo-beta-lactamase superfamily hydrolase
VEIVFQLAPETEAPAEMHLFLPQWGVLNIAENAAYHLHNFLPLRGAMVRDPRMWTKYLGEALELFGARTEVLIAQHHWPVWGQARVSGLTTELLPDYLAVRLNPQRADCVALVATWVVRDRAATFGLTLRNCVPAHRLGTPGDAAATLASSRRTLEASVVGVSSTAQAQAEGTLTVAGDAAAVEWLFTMFDTFPLMFNVVG